MDQVETIDSKKWVFENKFSRKDVCYLPVFQYLESRQQVHSQIGVDYAPHLVECLKT